MSELAAHNAVAAVVQMYATIIQSYERQKKLLEAQVEQLQKELAKAREPQR
jgi:hypothetical protein